MRGLQALALSSFAAAASGAATTCGNLKSMYRDNACCSTDPSKLVEGGCWSPQEPLLAGVMPRMTKPHYIIGMDIDYPPYAYTRTAPFEYNTDLDEPVGVGVDMLKAMAAKCGFDVTIVQAHWSDCWGTGEIGNGLLQGWYHGCATYTHASGVRNRYLEFSNSWAILNKPSGLITRLENGNPHIDGNDNLNGKTIVDVTGWAPTADTLYFVKNQCTQQQYTGFTVIQGDEVAAKDGDKYPVSGGKGANDKGLIAVLNGHADAMWIYGDQAANYQCAEGATKEGWDCSLWNKFGTEFAYVQSGMFGWMHNGTTVTISKKGAGVAAAMDACLEKFIPSQEFVDTCKIKHGSPAHDQLGTCIPTDKIKADPAYVAPDIAHSPYMFKTSDHAAGCASGYCGCPSR